MRTLGSACLLVLMCVGSAPATWGDEPMWVQYHHKTRPRIKVLDPGAAPHTPLRWRVVAGKREAGTIAVEKGHVPANPGNYSASAHVTCLAEQVSGAGEVKYRLILDKHQWTTGYDRNKATPQVLGTWAGTALRFARDAKGGVKHVGEDWPAEIQNLGAAREANYALDDVHAPYFPTEPVGVGARWEIVGKPILSWDAQETSVCTLRARDGDRVTIDVALTRAADAGQVSSAAGSTTTLLSYAATGTGTYELDLTCVLPMRATMSVSEQTRRSMLLRKTKHGFESSTSSRWSITIAAGPAEESTPR